MTFHHVTILRDEAVAALSPRDGGTYVDGTLGGGGHAERLLEACGPTGRVLGIDRDPDALAAAAVRLAPAGDRIRVVRGAFSTVDSLLEQEQFGVRGADGHWRVDGLLVDLGVSSHQLDTAARGFSLRHDAPLDMRMAQEGETAGELLDRLDVPELTRILRTYGDVQHAPRFARAILADRSAGTVQTTLDLASLCERLTPMAQRRGHHPATLVFQALRIAVNRELEELETLLAMAPTILAAGGVLSVITFHSLEDRLVKHRMAEWCQPPPVPRGIPVRDDMRWAPFEVVVRSAVPSEAEIEVNPRARSARLRAVRRRDPASRPAGAMA